MNGGTEAPSRRISSIIEIEAKRARDARQKADEKKALADAKSQGKEAIAALKARLAQEHATASQAKKIKKLRITAERKAERVRVTFVADAVCDNMQKRNFQTKSSQSRP